MQPHRGDDMDEMAEDYDMGDVEDDMYEEFQGRGLGDSDSDDEEYGPLVCLYLFQHYFEVVFFLEIFIICSVTTFRGCIFLIVLRMVFSSLYLGLPLLLFSNCFCF